MPWEGSTHHYPPRTQGGRSVSFSPCVRPHSTCPPNALDGERQDQPHTGKMDDLESRFWERESGDGGAGSTNGGGKKEMHQEGGKLAEFDSVVSEASREPVINTGTI